MSFWKPGSPPPRAEHQAKKPKHEHVQKVKVDDSNKKVKMTTASTSASTTAGAVGLSKAVLGMKFMQRSQPQAVMQAPTAASSATAVVSTASSEGASSSSHAAKKAQHEQPESSWFRSDHFVSDLVQAQASSSSSSSRSRVVTVSLGDNKTIEVEVSSSRHEVDPYARLPGRRSFNGCNRSVEKHYEQIVHDKFLEKQQRKEERATQKEVEQGRIITDEEMASRYDGLIGLPRGPNQGKKQKRKQ